jgi:hypothetical protein
MIFWVGMTTPASPNTKKPALEFVVTIVSLELLVSVSANVQKCRSIVECAATYLFQKGDVLIHHLFQRRVG